MTVERIVLIKLLDAIEGMCHDVALITPFSMPALEKTVKECQDLLNEEKKQ